MFGMYYSMAAAFAPVMIIVILLMVISTLVYIKSPGRTFTKFCIVPLALASAIALPTFVYCSLGFSYAHELPNQFSPIAFKTVVVLHHKVNIEVWIAQDDVFTRLYLVPYSRELEKILEEAKKEQANGKKVEISKGGSKKGGSGGSGGTEGKEYDMKSRSFADANPKAGAPEAAAKPPEDDEDEVAPPEIRNKFLHR